LRLTPGRKTDIRQRPSQASFTPQERTFHNRSRGEKLMKEMHHLAMATEQPLRDGLSPEEYDQF
jgi:hypothetical protein